MSALIGLAIAAVLWWALKAFGQADTSAIRRAFKRLPSLAGAAAAFAFAAFSLARGQLELATIAAGIGAWLLGWTAELPARLRGLIGRQSRGSQRRSAMIEMEVEGATGRLAGSVLAGPYLGRTLDSLNERELGAVRSECLRHDREGLRLIEVYLDRRFPGWREHAEADADTGRGADPKRGAMSKEEAYQVLGLEPGCGQEAVRSAHRALMKKLHPDQGGSTYLASRINQAKDVLLNRHR